MSQRLRVGVLDLLTTPAQSWRERAYDLLLTKQYASIMPQAIVAWCRARGHDVFYAAYYGWGDPRRWLPADLDLVFIASYTQASALAYALGKLYRRAGVRTVVGGPHAKAFPGDCLRFFDLVVGECDEALIADILADRFDRATHVSSARPPATMPTVAERWPEIRASALALGRPFFATTVPLLASLGCPYTCDFCTDGRTPYRQLPLDQVAADLRTITTRAPGAMVTFHDPNFAVKFDAVLDVLEAVPARPPYIVETSLSILRGDRMQRLGATNCAYMAPGVESWNDYSAKSGLGRATGSVKVAGLVEHFRVLHEHVPYLQANFLFGVEEDAGDEPVHLTREFMRRTPFVWPVINIPHPFGGTPLFERLVEEDRILTAMPFSFYYSPWLVTRPRHYGPLEYYRCLIELFEELTAGPLLAQRVAGAQSPFIRMIHVVRTAVKRRRLGAFRTIVRRLETDRQFRAFHEGESSVLPEFYHDEYTRQLGPFAPLLSRRERIPVLMT